MAVLRRLLTLAAVLLGAAVFAGPSLAIANPPPGARSAGGGCGFEFTLGSPHFLVHYSSDVSSTACDEPMAITETQAGDVLGWAEKAYAAEVGTYGFPAPPSDGVLGGDGRIDIYVVDLYAAGPDAVMAETFPDNPPPQASTSASIDVDAGVGLTPEVIAHQVFNMIQLGIWQPASASENWLLEESAEWMSAKVNEYDATFVADLGPSDMALDCKDPFGTNKCDLVDSPANLGYSRWPFWESVTQKFGALFVKEVFADGAANPGETAVAALQQALAAHGANLTDVFTAWTVQQMIGGYGIDALDLVKPTVWGTPISTGTGIPPLNPPLNPIVVPVNHLAARYLEFDRGDGTGGSACLAATLNLSVALPPGIGAEPYFYWNGLNSTPVALSVNGNTATTTLPWDTCTWVGNQGYLDLPNPSTDPTANGALFTVTATITVDPNTPGGQAQLPPTPVAVTGPIVAVPTTDVAPSIAVFGPELLQVPAAAPVVRLIVQSSGDGKLQASLGGTVLGTVSVRAGNNDLRWTLPASLLPRLRRSSADSSNVLTLTPMSSSGATTGTPMTRRVSLVQAPVKATPTAKAAAKAKAAAAKKKSKKPSG